MFLAVFTSNKNTTSNFSIKKQNSSLDKCLSPLSHTVKGCVQRRATASHRAECEGEICKVC